MGLLPTTSMNNPWYRKPRELREESQEGRIVAGKERKGLAAAVNVFFSMVGSLVWIKVWTGGTKGCGGKKRTHKDTIRWRRIAGILWFLYLLIPFLSSWSECSLLTCNTQESIYFFFTDMTPLLIPRPRADIRLGCRAANRLLALKHAALSIPELAFHFPSNTPHLSGYVFCV